jgi:hypothetical protein
MKRGRSFWREKVVYFGLATGLLRIVFGIEFILQVPRLTRGFGWNALNSWTAFGEVVVTIGAVLALISVLFGIAVAFGVGPNIFATTLKGVVVEEKIETLSDGSPVFNDMPEDVPLKHYLRVRLQDGEVLELQCKRETYFANRRGACGTARMMGGRLVSFNAEDARGN